MDVIFDLYGTLMNIHTDEERDSLWSSFAKKMKKYKEYNKDELRKEYLALCAEFQKDIEEIDILKVFEILYPAADLNDIAVTFRKLSTDFIHPYFGVKKLLKTLKKDGHRVFLLSNAQASFTNYELDRFKLKPYFDGIFLSSDYGIKKPNIEYYKKLIEVYNIDVNHAVMIGNDYKNDILPPKELGLKAIYIESNQSYFTDVEDKIVNFGFKKVYERINSLIE